MKQILCLSLVFILVGCNCGAPLRIRPIQTSDKSLACQEIILEINEAEFYKKEAQEHQAISMGEILMPSCWVAGYLDGDKSARAASARIEYLGHIYDLLDCGGKRRASAATPVPAAAPIPTAPPIAPQPRTQQSKAPEQETDPNKHGHIDSQGKIYYHSHPNTGKHSHKNEALEGNQDDEVPKSLQRRRNPNYPTLQSK